jgi:ribosomal protein L7/L12
MKRIGMTSILALLIATPSFATGIGASAESADCDNGTLGTYDSPTTLAAQWNANTINLDFYDGEEKLSSGQCTYDGGIELPNDPTKEGYEFSGWKVRRAAAAPQCSISDIDISIDGTEYGCTRLNGDTGVRESEYGLTPGSGEWATKFEYGIVKGVARCSLVGSSTNQTGNPTDDVNTEGAKYCWCKMTGYTQQTFIQDDNNNGVYLTGYNPDSKLNCIKAVRTPTGLGLSAAKALVESASPENPQLLEGATSADIEALTNSGCIVTGAGHYEYSQCSVLSSYWVFDYSYGDSATCANNCAQNCSLRVKRYGDFRRAMLGLEQE